MRLKYYLRGLGLGVLITTIILMISFRIHGTSLSDDEIRERAKKLGMIVPETEQSQDDTEAFHTLDEPQEGDTQKPDDEDSQTTDDGQNSQADENPPVSENPENSDSPENPAVPSNPDNPSAAEPEGGATNPENPPQTGTVTITVARGEVCRQIAEDLKSHNLVSDAEEFRLYMFHNGYDSLIQQGSFEIPYGATYEQIAALLTTKRE